MNASGVPGVLNRMAGTAPPTVAPFITPTRKPKTGNRATGVKPKIEIRIGSAMAIAIGPASPGVAPTTVPSRNPARIITRVTDTGRPAMAKSSGPWNTASTPIQM